MGIPRRARIGLTVLGIASLSIVLVVALAFGAFMLHVKSAPPRDEAMFIHRIDTWHINPQISAHLVAINDDVLIAEGDRACHWLDDQSPSLWRTDPNRGFYPMLDKYLATPDPEIDELAAPPIPAPAVRREAANMAWAFLCASSWEFHRPYHVFGGRSGGD